MAKAKDSGVPWITEIDSSNIGILKDPRDWTLRPSKGFMMRS